MECLGADGIQIHQYDWVRVVTTYEDHCLFVSELYYSAHERGWIARLADSSHVPPNQERHVSQLVECNYITSIYTNGDSDRRRMICGQIREYWRAFGLHTAKGTYGKLSDTIRLNGVRAPSSLCAYPDGETKTVCSGARL